MSKCYATPAEVHFTHELFQSLVASKLKQVRKLVWLKAGMCLRSSTALAESEFSTLPTPRKDPVQQGPSWQFEVDRSFLA